MNLLIIIIEFFLSLIIFLLMNYLTEKKINKIDTILIPNISMIILASIFTKLKNYMILYIILYLTIDFIYTFMISKKNMLINKKNYYINSILTLVIAIIIYQFFLLKVKYTYVDMEVFKNFIWILIIIYLYNKLNIKTLNLDKYEKDNYIDNYKDFVIINYVKLKNKYNYLIKNKDIEDIIYSFIIYEDYNNNKNIINLIKDKINNKTSIEEEIVTIKDKVDSKLKKIKNKDNKQELLIKEQYKNNKDIEEINNILEIISNYK